MGFKRVFQDTDTRYLAFKEFAEFEDEIVTYDHGTAANVGRGLSSPDGNAWSTLFSTVPGDIGNANADDGNGIVEYNDNLFIALYRSDATNPKVIEWTGGGIIEHLPNPQGGGNNNYMAHNLTVFDEKLWAITDVTAGIVDHRRVVYYYNGSTWTAITDYDGATYLDFNIGVNLPSNQQLHRRTRLFIFGNELYLMATRHNGAAWGWQVWRFDMENYDNFELLHESYEGFALSAIWELNNKIYMILNPLQTVNPTDYSKMYSSEDMETWTEETTAFEDLFDDFEDGIRDSRWTDEPNNGTIIEAGGVLTLAVAGAVNGNWWQPNIENAPFAKIEPKTNRITVITKLNSFTVNDQTQAGLIIGNTTTIPDAAGGYCISFSRIRADGTGVDGLRVADVGRVALATVTPMTTIPVWLRMRISGSGAGSTIKFDYSTDGYIWTNLHTLNNLTWSFVGLHAKNWVAFNAIAAPFEFFDVYEDCGFPYGETVYRGRAFLNCVDTQSQETYIYSFREGLIDFQETDHITTNVDDRGGGIYGWDDYLYAGKYMEIYRASSRSLFGVTEKNLPRKKNSIVLTEFTWKNKLGNELKEQYTFIDSPSQNRFYQGRIRVMSSIKRALDDKTGIFQNSDCTITLDNSDRKFSKLLTTRFLKNQIVRIYHLWTEEPEAWRQHVITMVVNDYNLKGTDFIVKLKDITQRYFSKMVPPNICTEEDYPDIDPDAVGKYMPIVVGLARHITGDQRGAVKAVYTDTTLYRYMAADSILNNVLEVYSADVLMGTPGDYSIVQVGGRTYIDFVLDQGSNDVTFNAQGPSFAAWDTGGYVRNPAYITLYFLREIMNLPASMVDGESFNDMANWFDNEGIGTAGYLVIQDEVDAMELLRQLLFTFGMKGFIDLDGKFEVGVIDINNYEISCPDEHLKTQVQLMGPPDRSFGLTEAINKITARWNYIPWARLWLSGATETQENYYEEVMEDRIRIREEPLPV